MTVDKKDERDDSPDGVATAAQPTEPEARSGAEPGDDDDDDDDDDFPPPFGIGGGGYVPPG